MPYTRAKEAAIETATCKPGVSNHCGNRRAAETGLDRPRIRVSPRAGSGSSKGESLGHKSEKVV